MLRHPTMGYLVDPVAGHVYSPHRPRNPIRKRSRGYIQITQGGFHIAMAHRVVWEAVHGQPIPDGMQVNHINGIKDDNRPENLEVVTPSENTKHAYRTGLARADGIHNGRYKGRPRGRRND